MDTQYIRVIPRDLFNESKLLKCVGKLVLDIHDNICAANVEFEHDGEPFKIGLMNEGYLSISNLSFTINDVPVVFATNYNSKINYPLFAYYEYSEYNVFDDNGNYTDEFIEFSKTIL